MGDVVIEHPAKVLVVLRVDILHVLNGEGLAQNVLVKGTCEIGIQHVAIMQRLVDSFTLAMKRPTNLKKLR